MVNAADFWLKNPETITLTTKEFEELDFAKLDAQNFDSDTIVVFLFDMIHSGTAMVYSVEHLKSATQLAREKCVNSIIAIDAAHAPGIVEKLGITKIDADFFIGNLHKWVFSAKSVAFFWAKGGISDFESIFQEQRYSSNFAAMMSIPRSFEYYSHFKITIKNYKFSLVCCKQIFCNFIMK